MASAVSICNSGLAKIGATRITALDDGSRNAEFCAEQYEKLRDDLLRDHIWNFALSRVELARHAAAPNFGWDYAYQLPTDCLRPAGVFDNDAGTGAFAYRIEGRKVLADAEHVWLLYVAQVTDENDMPVNFREALASLLAVEGAIAIADSNTLSERMERRFERSKRRARHIDAMEDSPRNLPDGSWLTERA